MAYHSGFTGFDLESAFEEGGVEEFHQFPHLDILDHVPSYLCPCQPFLLISVYNANEIWVHKQIHRGRLN